MELLFAHFGQVLLLLIWLICGVIAIFKKDGGFALIIPILASFGYALIFYSNH